jgi:uncharacterized protein involved in exopolysaccharide biosynthesis
MFVPEDSQAGSADLASAARQFGLGLAVPRGGWTAGTYVEVIRTPAIIQSLLADTLVVAEEGGRRATLPDLLEISASDSGRRVEEAARIISRQNLSVTESRILGTVRVAVSTPWPSVSQRLAAGILQRVQKFNLEVRQQRARAELVFAEGRAAEAAVDLTSAEDRLQRFLQRNRVIEPGSVLALERQRIERDIAVHLQVYTQLVAAREDARLRKVRDTPAITVLQQPSRPTLGKPRGTLLRGVLGGVVGVLLAFVLAFVGALRREAATRPDSELAIGVRAIESVLPSWVLRWM